MDARRGIRVRGTGSPVVIVATGTSIDFGAILLDLALVLIVAKIAAEVMDRIGVPAVLGEIAAGIIIGPSMLGLVESSDALRILAEIGVVILLAEVGMEMDLVELRRVGRASILVAIVGVVAPMLSGVGIGAVLGESTHTSLFLGAALAATSVGITARVFGDLRSLSSTEARIVLGAAVADDVLGLVILTVVTRIVQQGSVDLLGVVETIGLAVGFLAVAGCVGFWAVPRLFAAVGHRAVSASTPGVVAAGITFLFSAAASGAHLAPIIGAFVAGTALGRTDHHDRIARDFNALGSIFIPVFFIQIGVDTDVTRFLNGRVIMVAAVVTVVAMLGKIVASVGARGTNTDKLVIGLGMMPRGEVGLIFATIGVQVGVFQDDLYAVILLVVLITTVATPPLLRWRLSSGGPVDVGATSSDTLPEPVGGWVRVIDDSVDLQGTPPAGLALHITLDAAFHAARARPTDRLLEWLHQNRSVALTWDATTTERFLDVLASGDARSWRLLEVTGTIERALPEVARAMHARRFDASELDPTHVARFPTLEAVRGRLGRVSRDNCSLALAAFIVDLPEPQSVLVALERLDLRERTVDEVRSLVAASALLRSTITTEPYESNTRVLAQLADFLGSPLMVEWCRLLTEASGNLEDWQFSILLDVTTGVQALLAHPELIEGHENSVEDVRRREAIALTDDPLVRDRINHAAATYILSHTPSMIVRHASLVEPAPRSRTVRVSVHESELSDHWEVDIATRDMRGLLARICRVFADRGLDIVSADLATWGDGAVLDSFTIHSPIRPNATQLAFDLEQRLRGRLESPRRLGFGALDITLDNDAHPWHSVVSVYGADQPGLLQSLATAFAQARVNVHHARITTRGGLVTDRFEVSTRHGRKLNAQSMSRVRSLLS